jgi:hypothetical protein
MYGNPSRWRRGRISGQFVLRNSKDFLLKNVAMIKDEAA